MIIIISGPAGAGKSTIAGLLLKKMPEIKKIITYTTRPPRRGEKDGKHYNFISLEEIKKLESEGKLLECTQVHGNWYGTPKEPLEEANSEHKHALMIIDVIGMKKIKAQFPENSISIWLQPQYPNRLLSRLRKRQTKGGKEEIERRLNDARIEMTYKDQFDVSVINWENNKKRTIRDLLTVLEKNISIK